MPTTKACSGQLHGMEANWVGWQILATTPSHQVVEAWVFPSPAVLTPPWLGPTPLFIIVLEAGVGGIQLVQPGMDLAVVQLVAGQAARGCHDTSRLPHQHSAMPAQHACSGPGTPTAALLLEVTYRMGSTSTPAGTCPACCATGHTPSCKPVLGASMEGAMFVAAQLCQQGNNSWCLAQLFCTPLARHMTVAVGQAAGVLASSGADRQPQPGRPGWVRPPMTGGHMLGRNSAPRRQMETWEVAMESLQQDGADELIHTAKFGFLARAQRALLAPTPWTRMGHQGWAPQHVPQKEQKEGSEA